MKRHALCEVKALDGNDPNGEFEAILSAATIDRDGEIIDAGAFDPLPERIPIDIDHGMTVDTTVGSGVPYYDGDVLKIKGSFSSIPRAQELRTLVTEGHIARMSVTFMGAARATVEGVPHVIRAELLNAAFVPIPSNREATVLVAKAFAPALGEQPNDDTAQARHDRALADGATCTKTAHPTDATAPEPAATAAKAPASVVTRARLAAARALLDH